VVEHCMDVATAAWTPPTQTDTMHSLSSAQLACSVLICFEDWK